MTNLIISDANRKRSIKVDRLTINQGGKFCKIINIQTAIGDNEEHLCFMLILDNFAQK